MFIGSSSYLLAESGRGPSWRRVAYLLAESGVSPGGEWRISWRRVAYLLAESGVSPGREWCISWRKVLAVLLAEDGRCEYRFWLLGQQVGGARCSGIHTQHALGV